MRRRTYLTTSLAAAIGLAGCEDALNGSNKTDQPDQQTTEDESDGDPRLGLAEEFVFAAVTGDGDTATELLHPDSPLRDLDFESQESEELEDVAIEESELAEEIGDSATVRLVFRVVVDGNERSEEVGLELRRSAGAWTVWDTVQLPDTSPDGVVPQVSFETAYDSDERALTITHQAGDAVVASNLTVSGDGIEQTGMWAELGGTTSATSDGEPSVTTGDRVTVGTRSEYSVQLVWDSGQDSATLVSETGSVDEGTTGFRIGALVNLSGPLSGYGSQVVNGFLSGMAYKNGTTPPEWDGPGEYELTVGEQTVSLLVRDIRTDPNRARAVAAGLVTEEDVDALFGGGTTGTAVAVSELAEQAAVPFLACPALSTELTGGSCNEFVFRTIATSAMMARTGAQYIAGETDIERVALVVNDFATGQEWLSNYRETLAAGNVDVVLERRLPLGHTRWDGVLEEAESAGTDAIVGGLLSNSQASFLQAFLAADTNMQFFSHFWTAEGLSGPGSVLEDSLGANVTAQDVREANVGPFVTRYHWNQFENPVNDWLTETHADVYGTLPDTFTSSAFTAASALVQAAQTRSEWTSSAVVAELRGMTVEDTPKGPGGYSFQEFNNQARSDLTVAPVVPTDRDDWEASLQPGNPVSRVAGSDAVLPQSAVDCTLR